MPRFGAIDIGSNAFRLVVVEADAPNKIRELATARSAVRLGREVFTQGRIAPSAISAGAEALRRFRELLDEHRVDRYRAVATSAVREAENGALFVERARREAGIDVDVIEGMEEARLVRLGITTRLDLRHDQALLIDIGGGSTELSLLDAGAVRAARSLPVGTVRLLEAFLGAGAVDREQEALAREYIERQLREVPAELRNARCDEAIGTGGNFETLAQLCPAPVAIPRPSDAEDDDAKPRERRRSLPAEHPSIDVAAVRALLPKLAAMTPEERRVTYALRHDRADVIVAAGAIVLEIADALGIPRIVAPGIGLREGVLDELVEKHFEVWDYGGEADAAIEAGLRLGRRFAFDEAHGLLVARLSTEMFDQLRPLHRLSDRDRLLLHVGALLHDVGDFIRYEGHHRHSQYIIQNSDIVGLTPRERSIVAALARYHRKSPPDASHAGFRELERDDKSRVRVLSAILRLADALDREHLGKVTTVRVVPEKGRIRLHLTGAVDRQLEEWTVARKAAMFEEVFDLRVEIARS
jgi:exopolyphosphatase/guanosine-5'-triphosphate,3'-diphosphate pyrophosphatase